MARPTLPASGRRRQTVRDRAHVLTVGTPGPFLDQVMRTLDSAGYEVSRGVPGEVKRATRFSPPDAVVAVADETYGLGVVSEVRAAPSGQVPLIVITTDPRRVKVVDVLRQGADDCVPHTSDPVEFLARVAVKLRRVPVPIEHLPHDPSTGLYSRAHFLDEIDRELQRPEASRQGGVIAVIGVAEMDALEKRLGPRVRREVAERLADVAERQGSACDRFGWDDGGGAVGKGGSHLLMLLPGVDDDEARDALRKFTSMVAATRFVVANEYVRLTPVIGWLPLTECPGPTEAMAKGQDAALEAARHRDLRPVRYEPWMTGAPQKRRPVARMLRAMLPALSPILMLLLGIGAPLLAYAVLYEIGWDPGPTMYWVVVAALVLASVLIILECLYSLDSVPRPRAPSRNYPPASAIICAYLPNEAATIVDTVEAFLRLDYPGGLEIVLAYNTPRPLPVEDTLRAIACRDSRLILLPVPGSTSKAQNLNAAITRVRGEFVGVFDADHHPHPYAFRLAWHWLSNGYDVVQGHCVVRNGGSSWVSRMVAVEFESIYAVSHPGRTRMYGFGLFGGSNGFWRTDLLASTRMHGSMLTEDIDSTMRALSGGAKIAMDRELVSRELAPTTLRALWNQRSRWAQGWLQVSLKYFRHVLRSPAFSKRQKAGMFVLLGWRELQPWLTLQILPVLIYSMWRAGGAGKVDWAVPICLLAMLFTLAAGPVQAMFACRLAVPELRRRKLWFWSYFFLSSVFYSHFKNMIARNAHLKEALGDRQWRVTPRATDGEEGAGEAGGS